MSTAMNRPLNKLRVNCFNSIYNSIFSETLVVVLVEKYLVQPMALVKSFLKNNSLTEPSIEHWRKKFKSKQIGIVRE